MRTATMSSSRRSRSRRWSQLLANVLVFLLAVVALLLLVGLFLPRRYGVERSVDIQAGRAAVYADLSQLRRWPEWTAWNQEMDPGVVFTFGTPDQGEGANYSWQGPKLGNGELKLVKADPATGIEYQLAFDHGSMVSEGSIRLAEEGGVTRVTWSHIGDVGKNPVNRYVGLMMNRMIGPDFEKGLSRLKARAEASGKP